MKKIVSILAIFLLAIFAGLPIASATNVTSDKTERLDDLESGQYNPLVATEYIYPCTTNENNSAVMAPVIRLRDRNPLFPVAAEVSIYTATLADGDMGVATATVRAMPKLVPSATELVANASFTVPAELHRSNSADTGVWLEIPEILNYGTYRFPITSGVYYVLRMEAADSVQRRVRWRWIYK